MAEDDGERGASGGPPPLNGSRSRRGGPAPVRHSEPVFNLPPLIAGLSVALIVVHLVRTFLLTPFWDRWSVIALSFIPVRYGASAGDLPLPEAAIWSPVTYSFLHGSWTHLFVNLFWLLAFGSPVAARLGTLRAGTIGFIASLAGALAHYLAFAGELVPMIGASAVVAGFMGAAARFAFVPTADALLNVHGPAQSLLHSFTNPRFLAFLLVWLGLNYVFGTGAIPLAGEGVAIAWQAHLGGFFAGLLAFSLFERR